MSENRMPFLSINKVTKVGPGKVCDLGTVLVRHSLIAWIDDYRQESAFGTVLVGLELSHDAIHWWNTLGGAMLGGTNPSEAIASQTHDAWPARYVRANITRWGEGVTGFVSATIASA